METISTKGVREMQKLSSSDMCRINGGAADNGCMKFCITVACTLYGICGGLLLWGFAYVCCENLS
ncbi:MAG: hypothetical protein ACYSR6_01465 [Planctomycetota bacterium]|jgi:hypothetical protein